MLLLELVLMQIDGLSTSLEIVSGFQVLIDGFDYTGHFGAGIATTHDADASFASASFPVVVPFTVGQGFHVIEYRSGWKQPFATAFRGEIVARGRQYYQQHDTVQGAGVLRRTEAGIDTQMAFYNTDQDAAGVAAVLALIPAGYLPIPIVTDADIIIKIIEIYGITPETWNHQIHASELIDRLGAPYQWRPAPWPRSSGNGAWPAGRLSRSWIRQRRFARSTGHPARSIVASR
jgi:hypothetical protein